MTPLCTNCRGDCCVNKRGSVVDHGSALALHSCPDCPDGFAPTPAPDLAAERLAARGPRALDRTMAMIDLDALGPDCDEGKASPPFAWTDVDEEYRMAPGYAKTQRAPVPGGYLYRIVHYTDVREVCSFGGLAFVPSAPTRRGADELAWCADRIELGEHRREEE